MSDVEFDTQDDNLDIPKRVEKPIDSVLVNAVVSKKILPNRTIANYILIGLSICFFIVSIVFFSLYLQEGESTTEVLEKLDTKKANIYK